MFSNECVEARNDNIYIRTSIINPSFQEGFRRAEYKDARSQNIVDDACKYELNIPICKIPRAGLPIKYIDPLLEEGSNNYNNLPEAIRITFNGVLYIANLQWRPELNLDYFTESLQPTGTITAEEANNRSFYANYPSYYALFTFEHFSTIINETFETINNLIPVLDRPASHPVVSWNGDKQCFRLHLPPEYVYNSLAPPANIPEIQFNNRLTLIFGKSIYVEYGRLSGPDPNTRWSTLQNNIRYQPSITSYDVSNFVPPFNQNIYTVNRDIPCIEGFQTFGGWNRIEIRSNIALTKSNYVQLQDQTTGEVDSLESTQDNLLAVFYIDYKDGFNDNATLEFKYPQWQSVANSGALNNISYGVYVCDNLGNKFIIRVVFGKQLNLDLQLRKVID
jgi:hypothetical protein